MNQSSSATNFPAPLQGLIRPMLLISIGLHGLLLLMPIPSQPKNEVVKKETQKIKITQLPTVASKPSPIASLNPSPTPLPKITIQPSPIVRQQISQPIVQNPTPQPTPIKSPVSSPTPTATSTPTPTPTPTPTTPVSTTQDPFADFPLYPNAQPGSVGILPAAVDNLAKHTSDNLQKVVAYFQKQLASKKFSVQSNIEQPNIKVYKVSKGSQDQFLHLIFRNNNTVIVLAPTPIPDLDKLKDTEVVQQSAEERAFDEICHQIDEEFVLSSSDKDINYLMDFTKIPDAPRVKLDEGYPTLGLAKGTTPEKILFSFQGKLTERGFVISQLKPYGSVTLYRISHQTNKSFVRYISIVPTPEGKLAIFRLQDATN